MKIVTAEQMRNIDRRAVREWGIPGTVLMENAAAAIMAEMERFFDGLEGLKAGIICGKGNNGGDGLALARRLRIRGVPVRVALLAPFASVSGEAKVNLSILRKTDVEITANASLNAVADILSWSDIIVDAVLGVGLSSPLTGKYAQIVQLINGADSPVVAVDIPTGINADTGAVMGTAVKAELTVTMALIKRGLVLHPGASYAGEVRIADIGIPPEVVQKEGVKLNLLDRGYARGMILPRYPDSHKGDYGHLMIIAGSPGKAGAAAMAAMGALRAGAGLVSVASPESMVPIIQRLCMEAMCIPAAEGIDGTIGMGAEDELVRVSSKMSACAIGPGLTSHPETAQVVKNVIQRLNIPMVIDADGINALIGSLDILKRSKAAAVLTPHPGELGRLLGSSPDEVQKDRIKIASDFAVRHKVILVLKGAGTVIATPDGEAFVNSTGNPGMATAGTGDVLTGMIGGLLAQGYGPLDAACLAVYLHGLAGDLSAAEKTEMGMIAGDVIEKIPKAVQTTIKQQL